MKRPRHHARSAQGRRLQDPAPRRALRRGSAACTDPPAAARGAGRSDQRPRSPPQRLGADREAHQRDGGTLVLRASRDERHRGESTTAPAAKRGAVKKPERVPRPRQDENRRRRHASAERRPASEPQRHTRTVGSHHTDVQSEEGTAGHRSQRAHGKGRAAPRPAEHDRTTGPSHPAPRSPPERHRRTLVPPEPETNRHALVQRPRTLAGHARRVRDRRQEADADMPARAKQRPSSPAPALPRRGCPPASTPSTASAAASSCCETPATTARTSRYP